MQRSSAVDLDTVAQKGAAWGGRGPYAPFCFGAAVSVVEVRDHALWAKHIYGNDPLKKKIEKLSAGTLVELIVDGNIGTWAKMNDGSDGRPTPGIKPIGKARDHWHSLQGQRGDLVSIRER